MHKMLRVAPWASSKAIIEDKDAITVLESLRETLSLSDGNIEAIIARVDQIISSGAARGRSILFLVLTSSYLFTRYPPASKKPYNAKKFAALCADNGLSVTECDLNRTARFLRKNGLYPLDPRPQTLFLMYLRHLKADLLVTDQMEKVVNQILQTKKLTGGSPEVAIAGGIYVASIMLGQPFRKTQEELADIFGVTTASIRNFQGKFKKYARAALTM
jgi:transcription initiation factor TFIIIB Brf1 subunit/transcription initiation factor TFIIB